jgi:hypothetical protein
MQLKVLPRTIEDFQKYFDAPRCDYIKYLWHNRKIHHYGELRFKQYYLNQITEES